MNELPQFRTGFTIPQSESPIRIQFIHIRSSHANAVPLLLIPPFPFPSLTMGHLVELFTEPEDATNHQSFHLVIPSLPGLGFSDALPTNTPVISSTAGLLDSLMKRLSYPFYIVTNAGAGTSSPAQIDYKIVEWLSTQYPNSCLGTHFISPVLSRPKLQKSPLQWAKWSIAKSFEASISGYCAEDFSALRRRDQISPSKKSTRTPQFGMDQVGLNEPNTLAYALCDSPTGLLVFVLRALRLLAPDKDYTPTEIINFTQVAWLPGPESALRFWGYCLQHPEKASKSHSIRPRIGLTVFLGNDQDSSQNGRSGNAGTSGGPPDGGKVPYSCPSWARTRYNVLYTQRASGKPGLLAWERPEIIAAGARGVAAAVLKVDQRLKPSLAPGPETTPAEKAVAGVAADAAPSGDQPVATPGPSEETHVQLGLLAPPRIGERPQPSREQSDETRVASNESLAAKTPSPIPTTPSPAHSVPPPITVGGP
jgi:pimeloyl-ACP methyl ester carboxylesterase